MIPVRGVISPLPVAWNLVRITAEERKPLAAQRRTQARLLRRLVAHAHRNVPHYRAVLDGAAVAALTGAEDLRALPTLDRDQVRASAVDGSLLADGFGPGATRAHTTSGSSGIPVTMHNSEHDLGYLRASYVRDMIATGLRPWDRVAYFRPAPFLGHPLERLGIIPMHHIDTRGEIGAQADAFVGARPTFLSGFPNTIASIIDELDRRGVRYRGVRRVVFGGERLTAGLRDHILGYLGAAGLEVYAAVETFTIARACGHGALHLRPSDVVVEVEHDDGSVSVEDGTGEILVTRLRSEAMPLIRYRLGDRVTITASFCPCGLDIPVVREVIGRSQDLIYDRHRRGVSIDGVNMPLLSFREIGRIKVVQHEPGQMEIRVVLIPGADPAVTAAMADRLRSTLPGFDIVRVVRVGEIEPEPNGKIRVVHSSVIPDATGPITSSKSPHQSSGLCHTDKRATP